MSLTCHSHVSGMSLACHGRHFASFGMSLACHGRHFARLGMSLACHWHTIIDILRALARQDIHFPDMTKSKYRHELEKDMQS